MTKEKPVSENNDEFCLSDLRNLVLHNDDVNTFDFVILTLIEVCDHEPQQAEQCAMIAHYKGKCTIKSGLPDELVPFAKQLANRGLSISID